MVNVRFYGSLKQFGTEFNLDCKTPAEVVHALTSQIPKLRQFIQQGLFTVRVGREYLDSRYLEQGLSQKLKDNTTVHFMPTLKGSKGGGLRRVIAGAAIVAGALALGPLGLGVLGSTSAMMIGGLGASMLLGGVAQMLTKMPTMRGVTQTGAIKPESTKSKQEEKKQSTSFSNLSNMVAQGKSMPLAYGLIRTGTLVISQGVETMDVDRNPTSSTVDDTNKPSTGNTGGNTGIVDSNRHRDKYGKIYPWIAAREAGNG
nr:MAG TPA: tail assembly protein [Caudoviricetes sp.]DAS17969.1 MAG TPA: tail assembly protein [Bacteriophage sp.]